jgi:FKBP-type peptidyl-prolyl cis-trans isomerase FkpA
MSYNYHIYKLPVSVVLFILIAIGLSCSSGSDNTERVGTTELKDVLLGANTMLIDAEEQEINDFIERYGWEMEATGSGLRYMIYEQANGQPVEKDMIVFLKYSIRLITGDLIYSSDEDGMKSFRVGKGGVESGLEEGIMLMSKGDKARFIMPSHLAHGVPGDGVKIPRRATIIYDIELVDFN